MMPLPPVPTPAGDAKATQGSLSPDYPGPALPSAAGLALNFLLLTGGEFLAKLLTFAAYAYLARLLGPERYGNLEFVLASMVFFTLPVDLGIGVYGACELARDRGRAADLLREVAAIRLGLGVISFGALLSVAGALPRDETLRTLLVIYGVNLLFEPALLQWFFQAHDRMHWVAAVGLARKSVFAGLVFLLMRPGASLLLVGICEVASVLACSAVCLGVVRFRMGYRLPLPWVTRKVFWDHLRKAAPIGLSELAWASKWYCATVLLGLLVAGEALGWFAASHRVVMALHTFVWLYFFNLLPSLSRSVGMPAEDLRGLLSRSLEITAWGGLLAALIPTLTGGPLLVLAFGAAFEPAGPSFAVLVWMIPITLISGHYRFTLIAYGLQRLQFYCTLAAAGAAVVLGLLLIPRWEATGAAFALVAASGVDLILAYVCVQRRVAVVSCHEQLALPLLALTGSLAVYYVLVGIHAWAALAAALLLYLLPMAVWGRQQVGLLFGPRPRLDGAGPR